MRRVLILALLISLAPHQASSQGKILSPQEVFGFKMGEDRKLIDWSQIVTYFKKVDEQSERVLVQELGRSTLGKPFLLAIISSEKNIRNLKRFQAIQKQIAKPYTLEPNSAAQLIGEGKTVVLITLNIHATEIAASQESVELLYELATFDTPPLKKILEDVIILLIPSLNPDGQQIVTDWYRKTVGTAAEGSPPPELYHHYAGHDNNRDYFMFDLVESRHTAKVLYHEWFPEIVYDQHQMGSSGPRLFLPPYEDPVNPNLHPLLTAQVNMLGKFLVADLHRQGFKGVVTGTRFNAFFEGTMSKTPLWHNRIGILSEMASANLASPIFFPKGSLGGMGPNLPENKAQTNFLDPWEGGWWRLRDIIEYEKAVTYSLLEFAAIFKERLKTNFYSLNREATAKGSTEVPYGFVVPADQHNPNAAVALVNTLLIAGVEVHQTTQPLAIDNRKIAAGSYWISLAQPSRAYVKDLLEVQKYPDLRQYPGGPPQPPYDVTGWTLPMQMGVEIIDLKQPFTVEGQAIEHAALAASVKSKDEGYYAVERRFTNSFGLVQALLKQNTPVFEVVQPVSQANRIFDAGTFLIPSRQVIPTKLEALSREWEVPVWGIPANPKVPMAELKRARIGIYQPWATSIDEGWTRYVLDQYQIPYKSLHNGDFKRSGEASLMRNFDVIVLPDMSTDLIVEGRGRGGDETGDEPILGRPQRPSEYQGGIGREGVETIKEFVKSGGTLLCFAAAADFAIDKLRVPAVNVLKGVSTKEFYAPGSIFEVDINTREPLAFGMREKAHVYFTNNPTFRLLPYNREIKTIASYGDLTPLRSGWLLGERHLLDKVAMTEIPVEKGRVILYGFRVQHRAQTHGTYPLKIIGVFFDVYNEWGHGFLESVYLEATAIALIGAVLRVDRQVSVPV